MIKIFLNVSKDEQRKRLAEKLINPDKHYKSDLADIRKRQSVSFKEVARVGDADKILDTFASHNQI